MTQQRRWGDLIKAAIEGVHDNDRAEVLYYCDYRHGLKGDGPLPPCEKLDPLDFFTYLSRVFILEGETIDDLKVRLAGTVYRELYGFEVTALRVGELIPFENRRDLLSGSARSLRPQAPAHDTHRHTGRPPAPH